MKTPTSCFSVNEKEFENGTFRKPWRLENNVINPNFQSRVHSSLSTAGLRNSSFRRIVDGSHLMRFQSKSAVFKFLQHGVDGI